MFVELHYPESLSPQELDAYLANGWFRMGQSIFTTNFLRFKDTIYSSIWLRVDLFSFQKSRTLQKLEKLNSKFKIEIKHAHPSDEHEQLFAKYRESTAFEPAPSVFHLLSGHSPDRTNLRIFDTFEINVYDVDKLIATGYFDLGETSAEGISCFYDPAYKKHSLGKYLMYLKMNFCKENGFRYFYPGYFAPGYKAFDYKLDLARPSLEYLDFVSDEWKHISAFEVENAPIHQMRRKMKNLAQLLLEKGIKNELFYYDFYDADMIQNLNGLGLFDFPMFMFCFEFDEEQNPLPIVVYDVREDLYHLILCQKVYKSIFDEAAEGHYNAYLLQISRILYTGEVAEEMAEVLEIYERELMKIDG